MARREWALFLARLLQLKRDPLPYLLGGAALAWGIFSTRWSPLPPLDGGRAWADFLLSGLQACFFLYALGLIFQEEGLLLERLPLLPLRPFRALLAWRSAEALILLLLGLPGLTLGWILLPRGWGAGLLPAILVLWLQGFCLIALAGLFRLFLGRGGAGVLLLACWVLFSLSPFSWADPRAYSPAPLGPAGGSAAGAALFWAGTTWAALVCRPERATLLSGRRGGL